MLEVKMVYENNFEGDKYNKCVVTGIELPDWYCCLLFPKEIPQYLFSDIMDEFWDTFNSQITDDVYEDSVDNPTVIIYMYSPITKNYEEIYKRN